jgi:hypothetical protein
VGPTRETIDREHHGLHQPPNFLQLEHVLVPFATLMISEISASACSGCR